MKIDQNNCIVHYFTEFNDLILLDTATFEDVVTAMNNNGIGCVCICNLDRKFLGIIQDGDLRRLITKIQADTIIRDHVNKSPITLSNYNMPQILNLLSREDIKCVPIVENEKLLAVYHRVKRTDTQKNAFVVMAGGLGSRLGELTKNLPKPLITVGGVTMLSRILQQIFLVQKSDIFVSTRYLEDRIKDYIQYHYSQYDIRRISEKSRLGTAGALTLMDHSHYETIILMNADIINDISLENLLSYHLLNNNEITAVTTTHSYQCPFGVAKIDNKKKLIKIEEKPTLEMQVLAGIYVLNTSLLKKYPPGKYLDMPNLIDDALKENHNVGIYQHDGLWLDIGTPDQLKYADQLFLGD